MESTDQSIQGTMDTSDGMENFIEMVTSYKCKFCNFADTTTQAIATHVRSIHMSTGRVTERLTDSLSGGTHQKTADLSKTTCTDMRQIPVQQTAGQVRSACISVQTDTDTSLVISDSDISDTGTTLSRPAEIEIVSEMRVDPPSQPAISVTCSDSESTEAASRIDAAMQAEAETSIASNDPMAGAATTNAPITKELFLCGQCSVGFNSIDDCKVHMIQSHNVPLPPPEGMEDELSGRVSVGTQVAQRKKPGRKPKDAVKTFKPPNRSRDDSDEEYTIGKDGNRYLFSGGNRNQSRRIRTPRALKDDYYLEKRSRKTRDKRYTECYTVNCEKTGCYARFKLQESLLIHRKCHRDGEGEYGFQCCECLDIFTKWKELRMHLWRIHRVDTDLLACEQCEFKTDTTHKLKIHQQIHGSERPYCCNICGKGFKQFSQMRNHQMIHVEVESCDADKWYTPKQCEICKRSFANQKCLLKHVQAVHNKIKPYVCRFCGHSAARKAMLQLHLRTHTGEKPFKCDLCTYVTGDHNSLRRHKMRHSGHRPYKCLYCDYGCIQAISLKCHMKNKHPGMEGVYFCSMCHFRTVNKQSYENHLEDHKQGLILTIKDPPEALVEGQEVEVPAQQVIIENGQEHFQVQAVQTGEAQISAEDLAKLTANYEGLVPSDVSAAQLIYSALNAMSQNAPPTGSVGQSAHILEGVHTTLADGVVVDDNVRTHTITFHLATPGSEDEQGQEGADGQTNQVVLTQGVPVQLVHHVQTSDGSTIPVELCTDTTIQHVQQPTEMEAVNVINAEIT